MRIKAIVPLNVIPAKGSVENRRACGRQMSTSAPNTVPPILSTSPKAGTQKIINCGHNVWRILGFIFLLPLISYSATIHVPADQPTIQAGINAAVNGDTVLVAPGTYSGNGNVDIATSGKTIVLRSEAGPIYTIIDCGGNDADPHRGFDLFLTNETFETVIDGFTIYGGRGDAQGGGMRLCYSSPSVANCIFRADSAYKGGALWGYCSSPLIYNCRIDNNRAKHGGGVNFESDSKPEIRKCLFAANEASGTGGGLRCYGEEYGAGGVAVDSCVFMGNSAARGGGIDFTYLTPESIHTISNSVFISNTATYEINNLGGGISLNKVSANILNCLISMNKGGGSLYLEQCNPQLSCTDIWGNIGGDWTADIADQADIRGNISLDPLFCDTSLGNLGINSASPCVAINNGCLIEIGCLPISCGASVLEIGLKDNQIMHAGSHAPQIYWRYYDYGGMPQDSFNIQISSDTNWSVAEMWGAGPIASPDTFVTYAGAPLIDGSTYYLRLRVHNGVVWSNWYYRSFRMNSTPTVPIPASPIDSQIVTSIQPFLYLHNSTDPEADSITYDFMVYDKDSLLLGPIFGNNIPQQNDSTGWQVSAPLMENWIFFWKARAFDQYEYSQWSEENAFWINSTEEPPTPFTLSSPPDTPGGTLFDMLTPFTWTSSSDPDPFDSVHYTLFVALDSNFIFVQTVDSIYEPHFTLSDSLWFGTKYWWKVKATDKTGLHTNSTNTLNFRTWKLGDANGDWNLNALDVTFLINSLYKHGPKPNPLKVGDINASCTINALDITYLINYLYKGGSTPKIGCE